MQQKIIGCVKRLKVKEWVKRNQPFANIKQVFLVLSLGKSQFPVKSTR